MRRIGAYEAKTHLPRLLDEVAQGEAIDASVALAWCFADELSETADAALSRLEHETAIAPAIWPLEVANGLRTAEWRGRPDLADMARVRDLLL